MRTDGSPPDASSRWTVSTASPLSRAADQIDALTTTEREDLTRTILEVVLRQILVDGVFHADLHGGNILLTPDGSFALLDFGSVGRLDARPGWD